MKKVASFMILSLMVIAMIGAVSANAVNTTIIAGKIYNSDYTAVESGATVVVTCGGNVLSDTSLADGAYKVKYDGTPGNTCAVGDKLIVNAAKGSLTGSSGIHTIKATGCTDPNTENCLINVYEGLDVAVVNVPLVPEFGLIAGMVTVFGAVGVFFFVRKK